MDFSTDIEFDDRDILGLSHEAEIPLPDNSQRSIHNAVLKKPAPIIGEQGPISPVPAAKPAPPPRVKPRDLKPSTPLHRLVQPSILAAEAPPQDFRGLFNLAGIALVAMTGRLVIENLLKYGLLVRFRATALEQWDRTWPCLLCLLGMLTVSPVAAWLTEVAAFSKKITAKTAAMLHGLHIALVFFGPLFLIRLTHATLESGLVCVFGDFIMTMKLISYAHVYHDVRRELAQQEAAKKTDKTTDVSLSFTRAEAYPTLRHMYYFLAAPTLCFQLSYPRTPRIRWRFVVRRLLELIFCVALQALIAEQFVLPLVKNSLVYFEKGDIPRILERLLKLAVPNMAIWLLMFYAVFHSYLNLTGELLRFGDRLFYRDWWNAATLDVYWRNWNLPVHNWIARHLYAPAMRHGLSSIQAQALAFFISAVMHELLVSVPCHTMRFWAFWGMMMQVPLIALTRFFVKKLKQPVWGNCVFWISFLIFGQPLLIMLYFREYVTLHPEQFAAS